MAYVTADYYKDTYGGNIIPDEYINRQLEKASDQIDSMTFNRIIAIGINELTDFQQNRVKKAVCAHADFQYQYGPYLNMPVSGYSAGSISLSFKPVEAGGIKTSEEVTNLIKATGLMDRRL
ncbi:hypothetical protein LY28_00022 [Ruminiclostridium sufflavum DSM 19573]|uniref:Uncharacterized protein n=1 Tax=Ruminiclostridium sufflavum DSM 19573 TaxID=1121337 RepID=A0A318YBZ6_9FIRM|nr:hypothetical protein [Ruminiclostridium sufflavum]PYG90142.1 hypothetical protein LY28_00022 [Ruminiclostridium sufflavum DSM 19573]